MPASDPDHTVIGAGPPQRRWASTRDTPGRDLDLSHRILLASGAANHALPGSGVSLPGQADLARHDGDV